MLDINIKGGSRSQRKYATSMIEFVANKFLSRMSYIKINLHIKDIKDDAYGYAIPSDCSDDARPREFDIEVHSKLKLRKFLTTLAHEMVHVKQFAKGELYESTVQGKHRWHGQWLAKEPDYYDQPWEIEAAGREAGLFVRWAEKHKLGKHKWTWDD